MLEVKDLTFHYPDGHSALKGLSFSIDTGEKVALLGANGAGKSTLLLQLTGVCRGEGSFVIDGRTLSSKDLPLLRQTVGLVFQNPDDQLFCSSVEEDVAYGPRAQGLSEEEIGACVARALQAVQMESAVQRCPQNLSGGEKKRVALASILAMEPRLLILDEPTTGLDARARRSLSDILLGLDTALLLATHDLALAKQLTKRALVLDSGKLVFDGAIDQLLADEEQLLRFGLKA